MSNQPAQPLTDHYAKAQQHAAIISEYFDAFEEEGFETDVALMLTVNVQRSLLDAEAYGA